MDSGLLPPRPRSPWLPAGSGGRASLAGSPEARLCSGEGISSVCLPENPRPGATSHLTDGQIEAWVSAPQENRERSYSHSVANSTDPAPALRWPGCGSRWPCLGCKRARGCCRSALGPRTRSRTPDSTRAFLSGWYRSSTEAAVSAWGTMPGGGPPSDRSPSPPATSPSTGPGGSACGPSSHTPSAASGWSSVHLALPL